MLVDFMFSCDLFVGDGLAVLLHCWCSLLRSLWCLPDVSAKEGQLRRSWWLPCQQWTPWTNSWLLRMWFHTLKSLLRKGTSFSWSYELCYWLFALRLSFCALVNPLLLLLFAMYTDTNPQFYVCNIDQLPTVLRALLYVLKIAIHLY